MATEFATKNGTSHRLICCTFQKDTHSHIMVIKEFTFIQRVALQTNKSTLIKMYV